MKNILPLALLILAVGAFDIIEKSFSCSSNLSLANSTCTLALTYNTSLNNPIVTVSIPTDFTNVGCAAPCNSTAVSPAGGTINYSYGASFIWKLTNPLFNGSYSIFLSAASGTTPLTMDNSELIVVVIPQTVTATISTASTTVGAYTTYTLTIAALTNGIADGSTMQLSLPKNAINQLPYQNPLSCINTTNSSTANMNCSYSSVFSSLEFQKPLIQATSLSFQLNNLRMPSSTQPYNVSGYLAQGSHGVYATFWCYVNATTISYTPNKITLPGYISSASNTSTTDLNLALTMYCTSSTGVIITYDKSLTVTATNSSNVIVDVNASKITFKSVTCTSGKYVTVSGITISNPSVAKTVVLNTTTYYVTAGTYYYIENSTYTTTLSANSLSSMSASLNNYSVSATGVSLSLNFTTFSPLVNENSSSLAYYLITLDSAYVTTYITCYDLLLLSTVYCQKYNNISNIIKIQVGNKSASTAFSVRIDNLTNPSYVVSATTPYNVSTYSYNVDGFYQADSKVVNLTLTTKQLQPTITSNNATVGVKATITVNLFSDLSSGDTITFSSTETNAFPKAMNGSVLIGNFTFVNNSWQYTATTNLYNFTFQFSRTNPSYISSNELFPSINIANGIKKNAETSGSLYYPATTVIATLPIAVSTLHQNTGALTNTTLSLTFSAAYAAGDTLTVLFPYAYCTTGLKVYGSTGFQPSLPTTINGTSVSIALNFASTFTLGSTYVLLIQHNTSYTSGNFVLSYSTYTKLGVAKESASTSFALSASATTTTVSSIQLESSQTLRVQVSYPFVVATGTVTLQLESNSTKFNITGCSCLTSCLCTNVGVNKFNVTGINTNQTTILQLNASFGYFNTDSIIVTTRVDGGLSTSAIQQLAPFCSTSCWTCDSSYPSKCTSCFPSGKGPSQPYYSDSAMQCYTTCPSGTYTSSNYCFACDISCLTCSTASTCLTCQADYVKADSGLCTLNCSGQCNTCSISKSNCTTCNSTTILYKATCVQQCPGGTAADPATNSCVDSKPAYFPFLVVSAIIAFLAVGSKLIEQTTDIVTTCVAGFGFMEVACLLALVGAAGKGFPQAIMIAAIALAIQLIFNVVALALFLKFLYKDEKLQEWLQTSIKHKISLYTLLTLSTLVSFKLFRLVYSRLLGRSYFWAKFQSRGTIIPFTNILSMVHLILFTGLSVAAGSILLSSNLVMMSTLPQVFLYSVEIILLQALGFLAVLLDIKKPEDYFEERGMKAPAVTNEHEPIQNPTVTLQNIISLPNIEEVSQDALVKSPKLGQAGLKGRRSKFETKSNLTVKRENSSGGKGKPKSVERNRLSKSPPNKILSSRVSPGKDKLQPTHRSDGKDALPTGSVPVLVKQSSVNQIMLDVAISKEGSDGVAAFPNQNINLENSPEYDKSTVINKRTKSGEGETAEVDIVGFRRTADIKVPVPKKARPGAKMNDLFLGFLNNEEQKLPKKSKSRERARRASRQSKEFTLPNKTTDGFRLHAQTQSDGVSSSNFQTRFGAMYEFNPDDFSQAGPSELDKRLQAPKSTHPVREAPKSPKQRSKNKLKKTKDIYLQQNLAYGRRQSSG